MAEVTDSWGAYPALLAEVDDELGDLLQSVRMAVHHATVFLPQELSGAPRMVVAHAMNDFILLIDQVVDCDGRSASRTARAIFEHLVNWVAVQDEVTSRRYSGYAHVVADQLADLDLGLDLLTGEDRRKEEALLERVKRRTASQLRLFKRDFTRPGKPWLDRLWDRARNAGYEDDYRLYGVLSGVAHGDSGSLLGLRKQVSGDTVIHRTGPDLELARIAYLAGTRWMTLLLDRLVVAYPCEEVGQLSDLCRQLTNQFPKMHRALRKLDRQLWPDSAPGVPTAVVAFYGDRAKWFLHDPHTESVIRAAPPADAQVELEIRTRCADQIAAYDYREQGRPLTAAVVEVAVRPLPDARWVPDSSIFQCPEGSGADPSSPRAR